MDYTLTITNTGQAPLPDAAVTADFTGVFDDAVYNNDISVTTGTLNISPTLPPRPGLETSTPVPPRSSPGR